MYEFVGFNSGKLLELNINHHEKLLDSENIAILIVSSYHFTNYLIGINLKIMNYSQAFIAIMNKDFHEFVSEVKKSCLDYSI